jgi:predicted transcriptional regulator
MSTTTLKISDALKARIADAAELAGKSAHAFMVDALEAETRRAEIRRDFVDAALKAEHDVAKYGEVYSMDAAHRYFSDKLSGKLVKRPKPVALKARR